MYFQIRQIVLWPRNPNFEPRCVNLELGKVTVISGASKTGKSAVIPIVDYCLAAQSCAIPVKTIREACEWFGIVVRTESGEMLLARREPGPQRSTDDMFVLQASVIESIPKTIEKNTNAPDMRRRLDELAGLTNLDFSYGDSQSGFEGRPSFRDLSAFVFQPQNVIANPEVFFFKTDRYEHREKLRKIFPYILGAITPALLAKQYELRRLQGELRRKERELKSVEDVTAEWLAQLRVKVSEAKELGLLSVVNVEALDRDAMMELLRGVVARTDAVLAVSATTISEAVLELNALEREESQVSFGLTSLRRRLSEMTRIRDSASGYHDALRVQRERLKLSDWIGQHRTGDENCPICGSGMQPSEEKLGELKTALVELESEAKDVFEVPAAFDRELQRVQDEVGESAAKLQAVQIRKNALSRRSRDASNQQYQGKKVERFIGNLENALQLHARLSEDNGLREQVDKLRKDYLELSEELRKQNLDDRQRRALRVVNQNAAMLLPGLDAERPNDPISLEIDDLTIKVSGTDRDDYLSEIGSGANWLSYHIAVSLALQQFFLAQKHSPVPGFLFIDQPSQVYFPKKLVVRESDKEEDFTLTKDEDIDAVRKVFSVMASVTEKAGGRLQIVVLDHASRDIWGSIAGVSEFEEWRDGKKLVPMEWLT